MRNNLDLLPEHERTKKVMGKNEVISLVIYQTWTGKTELMRLTISHKLVAQVTHKSEGADPWSQEKEAKLNQEQTDTLRKSLVDYHFFDRARTTCQRMFGDCRERFLYLWDGDGGWCLGCELEEGVDDYEAIFNLMDALCALVWQDEEDEETNRTSLKNSDFM